MPTVASSPAEMSAREADPLPRAKQEDSQIRFRDVTAESGIGFVHTHGGSGRKYIVETVTAGLATFDYDNDGLTDIYLLNGRPLAGTQTQAQPKNRLYRNLGGMKFQDVTDPAGVGGGAGYGMGVCVGDYDNDGYQDLFVSNYGENILYHNNGDGTFTDATAASGIGGKPPGTLSVAAAWFDYDNDGLLDLIVDNYTLWSPESDIRCTTGGVEYYCDPRRYQSVPPRLYHNLGHGKFEDVTDKSGLGASPGKGMGISIADSNNDGWPDIFIANDTEPNSLFINRKDGTFEEKGLELGVAFNDSGHTGSSMGSDANDYDNDGNVDIFYNNLAGQIWQLLRNDGNLFQLAYTSRIQTLSLSFSGWSTGFIDYNNDGWKDIYSANGHVDEVNEKSAQHDTLFENVAGKFVDVSGELGQDFQRIGYQRGSAFGDLNNDGAMDLVVTSLNRKPRILINSADSGNHWLLLNLTGHKSARDAIGAKIKLTTASGRVLYNHVAISVGFMSSSDKRVHFGLGNETRIASIEIRWPSGVRQLLKDIQADRQLNIDEPREPAK